MPAAAARRGSRARRQRRAAAVAGLAGAGLAAALLVPTPAAATEDHPWDTAKQLGAISVRDRSRLDFLPEGIRIGNYVMLPHVGYRVTASRDTDGGAGGGGMRSVRSEVMTGLELRSHLPRHLLDLMVSGRGVADHEREELRYIDGKVRVLGRLDISHATALFGEATHELVHDEDIDQEGPKGARRPAAVRVTRAETSLQHRAGRIDAAVGSRYTHVRHYDAEANDGSIIEQSQRDYDILEPFVRLGARISPGYRVFTEVSGRRVENRGDALIDRDAVGLKAVAGVELELTPLVKLRLEGGYFQQDYAQPGLLDIATGVYDARLDWYVSPLVTLSFNTRRDVQATTYGVASGRINTSYTVRGDYEVWRNLIVSAEATLKQSDYVGEARTDTYWIGRIGAEYLATKNWLFTIGYEHQELDSSVAGLDRRLDKISIGAKYRF